MSEFIYLIRGEAKDLPHATEITKDCPNLEVGGSVEVRPIQKIEI